MVLQSLENIFGDGPLTDEQKKKVDELNKIIDTHWQKPNSFLKRLCRSYNLKFSEIMDEYLDYYNIILIQTYKTNGEDSTLPALKDMYMKEALYHSLCYMSKIVQDRNQLQYRKQRAKDFGSGWWRYGIGS